MTINQLGAALNKMCEEAPKGHKTAMIHVFGIKYAQEIKKSKFNKKEIAKAAKISETYFAEINKGVKLGEYVTIKKGI
ncbi:HTH-like domain-containing protein [Psychroserpens damuponensis]|uniref:HTH-like domain-containing protein n=1 Tax=Psychroserpens damuponensis TaxID=943936 RepID=UPI00058E006C|nr:hypothetical protein [Psychroserpens damuponensis]